MCRSYQGTSAGRYLKFFSTISIEQKYCETQYYRDTYHLVSTKFKTPYILKACTAVTTIRPTSSTRNQLNGSCRLNRRALTVRRRRVRRTGNRTSSPPSSSSPACDRLHTHLSTSEVHDFVPTVASGSI